MLRILLCFFLGLAPAFADGLTTQPYPRGQVPGTITNDSACTTCVGYYNSAQLPNASALSLTSGVGKTIISISVPAGDFDVWGVVQFIPAASTTCGRCRASISNASDTVPGNDTNASNTLSFPSAVGNLTMPTATPVVRVSNAIATTYYLVADGSFAVSTMTAAGEIRYRRAR